MAVVARRNQCPADSRTVVVFWSPPICSPRATQDGVVKYGRQPEKDGTSIVATKSGYGRKSFADVPTA
jgi:hypothetical protein